MHELSIAGVILDAALRHAEGRAITGVRVRIGHLRQVVPDALRFAWEVSIADTPAAGAALDVGTVPARVRCRACSAETRQARFPLACGRCGGLRVDVVSGEELEIEWIEVEQAAVGEETVETQGGAAR